MKMIKPYIPMNIPYIWRKCKEWPVKNVWRNTSGSVFLPLTFSPSWIYSSHHFSFSPKSMQLSCIKTIDFYVSVIDNYGDMGFAVNLVESLHARYPSMFFRFFSDDEDLFQIFFPGGKPIWIEYYSLETLAQDNPPLPSSLIFSFFDYKISQNYLIQFHFPKTIVVFSYFVLHEGLESLHGTKYTLENGQDTMMHFVPSLLSGGWGVIVNPLVEAEKEISAQKTQTGARKSFLKQIGYNETSNDTREQKWISIFAYQDTLEQILEVIAMDESDMIFWICGNPLWIEESSRIRILPFLSMVDYGVFQSLCDANVVRGENSLCQALISGKPALWDIYKESNWAHSEKIEDYLVFLETQFPAKDWSEYAQMMRGFNGWDKKRAFSDFVSWYAGYGDIFRKLWEYTKSECDLIEKLEKILA